MGPHGGRPAWWRRATVSGGVGLGLAAVVGAMVSLHPHQQVYFNVLGTRTPPGQRYDMDYWQVAYRQGLEYLRARFPAATLYVQHDGPARGVVRNRAILPAADRAHLVVTDDERAEFFFYEGAPWGLSSQGLPAVPARPSWQAYGSPLLTIVAPHLVWGAGRRPTAAAYRAAYQAVVAAGPPVARAPWALSLHNGALYYIKEACRPAETAARFFLHLVPVAEADLPQHRRPHGFATRDFVFAWWGRRVDGRCLAQVPLPSYPIARIKTGQVRVGTRLWAVEVPVGQEPPAPPG